MAISVILPTYNRAAYLERAVVSVLRQKRPCAELLVVDDGSTDGSAEILERLVGAASVPIRVLRQANRGAAAARNLGIREARSPMLAFLDSDDWWLPDKLAVQAEALAARPEMLIAHTREFWFRGGRRVNQKKKHDPPDGDIFTASLPMCVVGMSTVLARAELFSRYGLFDTSLPCCEDYDLWLRVGCRESFLLVPEALTGKDGGRPDQLSAIYRQGMDVFRIRSLCGLLDAGVLNLEQQRLAVVELARKCSIYAKGCVKHGRPQEGAGYLALAQRYQVSMDKLQ